MKLGLIMKVCLRFQVLIFMMHQDKALRRFEGAEGHD